MSTWGKRLLAQQQNEKYLLNLEHPSSPEIKFAVCSHDCEEKVCRALSQRLQR